MDHKGELFWKTKALNKYGIDKQIYDYNWKQTVEHAHVHNMINMNHKWINGSTYKQILDKALLQEYELEFFTNLQGRHLCPYVNKDGNTDEKLHKK